MTEIDASAIAHAGDAALQPALHRRAIEALAGSPLPALLDSVQALQKAMLAADPKRLRRSVGWFGRLLGRDIGLQAEARQLLDALGVHALATRRRLDEVKAHRDALQPLHRDLLHAVTALAAEAEALVPLQGEGDAGTAASQRLQHLLTTAGAYRITASHLELALGNLGRLVERIEALLPRVRLLLEQNRMLREDRARQDALASTSAALDALRGLLHDNPPTTPPASAPAPDRSTP